MSDSFEFTLHYPLSKAEDWNKLSDTELENTMYVTFITPQGRQVRYIKCEVLDKIRAEIVACLKALDDIEKSGLNIYLPNEMSGRRVTYQQCLGFIDKYNAESEKQDE